MADLFSIFNNVRKFIIQLLSFFSNIKELELINNENILYAYDFPLDSEKVLRKLYSDKKIILINGVPSNKTVIKNIVFYSENTENLIFETEYDVEKTFKIGKRGKDFHRNLYILTTINKYDIEDSYLELFKSNKIDELIIVIDKLLSQCTVNHNFFNIKGILLQQQDNFFKLIDTYISAQKVLERKKLSFLIMLIDEYVIENSFILTSGEVRKLLYNIYQNNNLRRVNYYFIGFPKSLHETIHYIYPFFKIQFLNDLEVGQKNIFYSNNECISNGLSNFDESIAFFNLGKTEKTLHHNLYILNFLKSMGMENELKVFLYDCNDLTKVKYISTQIERNIETTNQEKINTLCLLYARLSEPDSFFNQLSQIKSYQDLSFLCSIIEEQLFFTEEDVSVIKDPKLLKILSLRFYKRKYYDQALILLRSLLGLGNEEYQVYHALTLYKLNRFKDAEAIFKVLLSKNKNNYANWSYIGMTYMQQFRYSDAINIYKKVLELVPLEMNIKRLKQIARYHQIIANAALRDNKILLAKSHYLISLIYWPSNYSIYVILNQECRLSYLVSKKILNLFYININYAIKLYENNDYKYHKVILLASKVMQKKISNLVSTVQKIKKSEKVIESNHYLEKLFRGNLPFLYKQKQLIETTIGRISIIDGDLEQAQNKLKDATYYSNVTHLSYPYTCLADLYLACQKYDLALINFKEVLKLKENDIDGINGIAKCYLEQGDYEKAKQFMNDNNHIFNKKLYQEKTRVLKKRLAIGTKDYENVWSYYKDILISRTLKVDKDINYVQNISNINSDENVFLVSLWGPGDEIRWASLYNEMKYKFPNLTISCEPRLHSVLSSSFPDINFISVNRTIRGKYNYSNRFLYNELPSVALISAFDNESYRFSKTQDKVILVTDIIAELRNSEKSFTMCKGYMYVDNELKRQWLERIKNIDKKPKIGICWKSGLMDINRGVHYTEIEEWLPLFEIDDFTFINLQYAGYEEDIKLLKSKYGIDLIHFHDLDLRDDFDNTSAMMSNLDYIISPCTTMIELAGALGVQSILISNASDIISRIEEGTNQDLWFKSIKHIKADTLGDKKSIVNQVVEYLKSSFS